MSTITQSSFGTLDDGREVLRFDMTDGTITVSVINFGATILSVRSPDKEGTIEEITLQHDNLDAIVNSTYYFGCTVGRIANRVADGRFSLDGKEYKLATNNGPNHLHGGNRGFDKALWEVVEVIDGHSSGGEGPVGVRLRYVSPDGEEGYPGTLTVEVTYILRRDSRLEMDVKAEALDAPTPAALTNHTYWNLSGNCKKKVTAGHSLKVNASRYCVLGANMIPTGELRPVDGELFDLRNEAPLGERVPQIDGGGKPGYDHCFAVDGYEPLTARESEAREKLRFHARLVERPTDRFMDVYSTQPGVQVYTANWLPEDPAGAPIVQHGACCLETEFFPNAINQPLLKQDIVVRPCKPYRHLTVHHFGVLKPSGE